jgi:hypothetical protein
MYRILAKIEGYTLDDKEFPELDYAVKYAYKHYGYCESFYIIKIIEWSAIPVTDLQQGRIQ